MTSILALICATAFMVGFSLWGIKTFGYLPSISQTYYELIKKYGEDAAIYFTAWCSTLALLVAFPLHEITMGDWWNILAIPICAGLVVVGVTPKFIESKYASWHFIGAACSAVGALTLSLILGYYWVVLSLLLICFGASIVTKGEDGLYWLENALIYSLLFVLWGEVLMQ